jgi:hypothetical protein
MPNTILKRWNGTAFEELYPKTTVTQISASGTPSIDTFLRGDGTWATPAGGGGSGDVVGPTSAANNNIAVFDGITGKLIKDGGNTIAGITYTHPTGGANTTITASNGLVLSAITVNSLGHTTSVSSKTLAAADIPNLSATKITADRFALDRIPTSATANRFLKVGTANTSPTYTTIDSTDLPSATNSVIGASRGVFLAGSSDGDGGVHMESGVAYATKTFRGDGFAQQTWATLLVLTRSDSNFVRFVDLTLTRTEGSITYYIGSITIDVNSLVSSSSSTPTLTTTTRWRLNSRNSSNTQLTLPIFMYRLTSNNTLRVYVDNSTAATYDYECVGYY